MRVLVNALSLGSISGRHVLYGHLTQLARWTETEHEFLVLAAFDERHPDCLRLPNVTFLAAPQLSRHWATRAAWEIWSLPGLLKQNRIDLYFTPNGTILPRSPVPQVSLAQNPWPLVPSIHRTGSERWKASLQRRAYRRAHLSADLMAFNSRHMLDLYQSNANGQSCQRNLIVYQGINDETHDHGNRCDPAGKAPWAILAVSAMAHWKGAEVLIAALQTIRRKVPAELRLVGPWPDSQYEQRVRAEIAARDLTDSVVITGQVSNTQLLEEYAAARVFCLLSRCESFGIPAVEAQIHGVPVIGSSACAMPEICGKGGHYCDPDDPASVASCAIQLLTNQDAWTRMSALARQNAARYRWEICSRPLLEMFSIA